MKIECYVYLEFWAKIPALVRTFAILQQLLTMKYSHKILPFAALLLVFLFSFSLNTENNQAALVDSPGSSDKKAIEIAREVLKAMGGKEAWDNTHYISWNFFGSRSLLWDKWTGLVRIEWLKKQRKVIVNLSNGSGKVQLDGVEQTHPDSLAKYLQMGKEVWINDAYWLVMPFKLLDPGVTLKYLGQNKTEDGRKADLLQLTFDNVGVTPKNKYKVWVDSESRLVTQWAYFEKFTDTEPKFTNAWSDYKRYGNILLSGSRGKEGRSLYPIEVMEQVTSGIFTTF